MSRFYGETFIVTQADMDLDVRLYGAWSPHAIISDVMWRHFRHTHELVGQRMTDGQVTIRYNHIFTSHTLKKWILNYMNFRFYETDRLSDPDWQPRLPITLIIRETEDQPYYFIDILNFDATTELKLEIPYRIHGV